MSNAVNWFEIPSKKYERAVKFYGSVFEIEMQEMEMMGIRMAMFPADQGVGGAVVYGKGYVPSKEGVLIYLNGGKDLSGPLARVEKSGGKILVPKTKISDEIGYFAIFEDTEGNRIALHS